MNTRSTMAPFKHFIFIIGLSALLSASLSQAAPPSNPTTEAWWPKANKFACKFAKNMQNEIQFNRYQDKLKKKAPEFNFVAHYSYIACGKMGSSIFSKMIGSNVDYPALHYIFQQVNDYENGLYQQKTEALAKTQGLSSEEKVTLLAPYQPKLMALINGPREMIDGNYLTLLDMVIAAKEEAYSSGDRGTGFGVEEIQVFLEEQGALTYQQLMTKERAQP